MRLCRDLGGDSRRVSPGQSSLGMQIGVVCRGCEKGSDVVAGSAKEGGDPEM